MAAAALTTDDVVADQTLPTFESARNFHRPPPFSSDSELLNYRVTKVQGNTDYVDIKMRVASSI